MNFLKVLANIRRGQKVLIIGASGSLGSSAVQLARHFGAEVTGVCSTTNVKMVKSLGPRKVIDYSVEDFTKAGKTYDIIYDTVGKSSFSRCKSSLREDGVYVSPVLGFPLLLQMLWTSKIGRKKAKFSATGILPASKLRALLQEVKELIEAGVLRSVIDRRYPPGTSSRSPSLCRSRAQEGQRSPPLGTRCALSSGVAVTYIRQTGRTNGRNVRHEPVFGWRA